MGFIPGGSCIGTQLVANEFIGNQTGITLENNGNIGPQGSFNNPLRNEWKNVGGGALVCPGGNGTYATFTLSTDGTNSQFDARNIFPLEYPSFSCHGGFQPIVFFQANPSAGSGNTCQSPNGGGGNGGNSKGSVEQIVKDRIGYVDLLAESRYQDEQFALSLLEQQPAWRQSSPGLDAWYQGKQGTTMDLIGTGQTFICSRNLNSIPSVCAFTPANPIEQDYRTLLEVLHRMQGDSISPGDSLLLEAIASHCPLEHGAVVYQARSLLQMRDAARVFDYQACASGNKTDDPENEEAKEKVRRLKVYPNPGTGLLWMDPGDLPTDIELLDARGVVLERWSISTTVIKDLNHLAKGIYLLRYHQGDSTGYEKLILE